jgi:hypothetical protein
MAGPVDGLRQQIENDRVVVFAGAGVSLTATGGEAVAGWEGLLKHGIDHSVQMGFAKDPGMVAAARKLVESGDTTAMLAGASMIKNWLGGANGGPYVSWLNDTVGQLMVKDSAVIEALRDLGLPIVTTNYDALIEQVTGWRSIGWHDGAAWQPVITRNPGPDRQLVIHLHGDYLRPKTVVLDAGDYASVLQNPAAQAMMRAAAVAKGILFVGFGAGIADPNFAALREWLRGALPDSQFSHFRLVKDEEVAEAEREHKQAGENVLVLSYGAEHADLASFLEGLRPSWSATHGTEPGQAVEEMQQILELRIGEGKVRARATPNLEDAEEDLALDRVRLEMIQVLEEWLRLDDPVPTFEATRRRSPREAIFLGRILYESVFQGKVKRLYEKRRQGGKLSLVLKVRTESMQLLTEGAFVELTSLPWELLYSPEGWLATLPGLTLARAQHDRQATRWQRPRDEQRILVVLAQPRDVLEAMRKDWRVEQIESYRAALARILWNLRALREHPGVKEVRWLLAPTIRQLQAALTPQGWDERTREQKAPPDIVHYIGHGTFEPLRGQGYVALLDEGTGEGDWYEYSDFAQQLQVKPPPKMVFLHLCQGPRESYRMAYFSFARASFAQLARQVNRSVRLVVAMQYPMSPDVGQKFTEKFYQYLRTMTVAEAVQTARRDIVLQQRLGGPLLYMDSEDGLIVPAERERVTKAGANLAGRAPTTEPQGAM